MLCGLCVSIYLMVYWSNQKIEIQIRIKFLKITQGKMHDDGFLH